MSATFRERGDKAEVENGTVLMPKFDEKGLIPAVATEYESGEVLMFAYMNRETLLETMQRGEAVFWSRTRGRWHKGDTSGNVLTVRELRVDCDQDVVWLRVTVQGHGACCHTGFRSCFFRAVPLGAGAGPEAPLQSVGGGRVFDPSDVYGKKES